MSDPRAPYTKGIQRSESAPGQLASAIQKASVLSRWDAARAARDGGPDGHHDHADGGDHTHDHLQSRLVDHDGRIANLENSSQDTGGNPNS